MRIRCSAAALRRSKWAAMAASIWIQCTSGSSYCFSVYSPLLKSSQSYDQSTLDSVAFFKDVGANVGVLSGVLYSSTAASPFGGPWVVLVAAAVQCFAGYFLMWLSVTGALPRPPVPLMCLYMLLAAHSQTFFNTANVVTAVENFPDNRGTVVGIMKGFLGLSGAILIQVYQTLFSGNPSHFLLMIALLPSLLPLLLMYFVVVQRIDGADDKQLLDGFSLIALTIAGYLMTVIIGQHVLALGLPARVLMLVILLLLLLSPLAVVIKAQSRESKNLSEPFHHERIRLIDDTSQHETIEQKRYNRLPAEKTCIKDDHIAPREVPRDNRGQVLMPRGEDFNLLQAMQTLDFWLLFLAMSCGMGSGLATVNNTSQIGGSLGYTSTKMSTLVSMWSLWNFLGRFGAGYASDYFLRSRGCARPLFIALTLAIMTVGHVVISSGLPGALPVGFVLVGVCYGSQWSLMPSIASEIFGLRHFGTIFNTVAIASPIGSYLLSVRVVGYIYDMESSSSSGGQACTGNHCFMLSFLIMASVTLFGSVVAWALFFRTRRFYEQVIYARIRTSVA